MIETPSLRDRLTAATVGLVVVTVLLLEGAVYLSLRDELDGTLDDVLDTRAALVEQVASDVTDATELAAILDEVGVPAVVTATDGAVLRSGSAGSSEGRRVVLSDGTTVDVLVSRAGVDATLQRVLVLELGGTAVALLVLAVLLRRATVVVTRPLDRMVETASRIAAGEWHQRLSPTQPDTELGRLAAAFDATFDALEEAITEAEQAESRSRRFLADAAHQLRTPLAGLRASAELLLARPDDEHRERLAGNVAREAARLSRLVDQLLRVARIDRGERPVLRPTDPRILAEEEVDRQRELAPSLAFSVETARDEPPIVHCDPVMIREALANLLDNARRHASSAVAVEVAGVPGAAVLSVRDDGPGLPEELHEAAFDRFSSEAGGSGLGLPIARGIAQIHGGDLRWEGDAFVLTVPVERWG